jgi:hypothetical protein
LGTGQPRRDNHRQRWYHWRGIGDTNLCRRELPPPPPPPPSITYQWQVPFTGLDPAINTVASSFSLIASGANGPLGALTAPNGKNYGIYSGPQLKYNVMFGTYFGQTPNPSNDDLVTQQVPYTGPYTITLWIDPTTWTAPANTANVGFQFNANEPEILPSSSR